jgi:hypothetical protein
MDKFVVLCLITVITMWNTSVCLQAEKQGIGVRFHAWIEIFLFTLSRLGLGPTQPPAQWVRGEAARR